MRCIVCGKSSPRAAFLDGALRRHLPATLTQAFIGCGSGVDADGCIPTDRQGRKLSGRKRGGLRWTKSRPTIAQLEIIAAATLAATERLQQQLGGNLPDIDPRAELVSFTDDELTSYFDQTEREYAELQAFIAEEMRRRVGAA